MRIAKTAWVAALGGVGLLITTSCSTTAASAPIVTVTTTVAATTSAAALPPSGRLTWPAQPDRAGPAPSPAFPSELDGWQRQETWNGLPRAFTGGGWTPMSGPDDAGGEFPATMNGCDDQRFLVRWRAVNDTAKVAARWSQGDVAHGEPVIANAGWMDVDGCRMPEFRLMSTQDDSTLTDVTVAVQRWAPAP